MCEFCGCGFFSSDKPVSTAHTIVTLGTIPVVVVETTADNDDPKGANEDISGKRAPLRKEAQIGFRKALERH